MSKYDYVDHLLIAYSAVPSNYLNQQVLHSLDGRVEKQDIERVFLAELYHQWRAIMTVHPELYQGLILHSEIGKRLNRGDGIKHPDLVLHGGQIGPRRTTHNKVFCELKMDIFDADDAIKALYALDTHNYDFAVCIIHNLSFTEILTAVRNEQQLFKGKEKLFSRLLFFNNTYLFKTLNSLLKING